MYITVLLAKGGGGKSTTTINLAATFAAKGLPGIVVDLNPQQSHSLRYDGSIPGVEFVKVLPEAAPKGGFVIVDSPPLVEHGVGEALALSDLAIIPCNSQSPVLESLRNTFDTLFAAQDKNPNLQGCILFNAMDKSPRSEGLMQGIGWITPFEPLESVIPFKPVHFDKAFDRRVPLVYQNPKSPAAIGFVAAGEQVLKRLRSK